MGHLTSKDAYKTLDQRLNLFPQGAPPSESLYKILQILFTEKEARMVSQLPIRPFTIAKAAKIWQISQLETEKQEPVLLSEHANHILDYERASYLIDSAEYIGVGTCYYRHNIEYAV